MPKRKRKWVKRALKVRPRRKGYGPHHVKSIRVEAEKKGALHRQLGIPLNRKIPLAVLRRAAKVPGLLGKRARLALTMRGFRHKRRRYVR